MGPQPEESNENVFIGPNDDNINENLCIRPDENSENIENVELVQVLSVIRDEQPPPGSAIIAEVPEVKPKGSAKRKSTVKSRKVFEPPTPKKQEVRSFGSKYNCGFCGKTFPQPYRLSRHILEVHKKEKRHICQFCEKTFFKLSSKKRHELTHVTHDTWKCSRCMKIFKDESSLKYHVKKNVCLTKKSKMAKKLQNVSNI